ncbi:hypothetical protein ACR78H_07340 [Sphingobacterium siyangense]|uniref:hypothetical protein n=1 Tax=Sphingobacterium siyangense TaxID=459529 RepID=UPI003DA5F70E
MTGTSSLSYKDNVGDSLVCLNYSFLNPNDICQTAKLDRSTDLNSNPLWADTVIYPICKTMLTGDDLLYAKGKVDE